MQNNQPASNRKFLLRFGVFLLTFTVLCLMLAAFAPQPAPVVGSRQTPSATYGPTPTPVPPDYCGGFHVRVEFRGFSDGKPIFTVYFRDDRDRDCDGIPNGWDNCPYSPNPDQIKSDDEVFWGDACQPESGFRLNGRASEVIIYQMSNGSLHLYSPEGEKLGELSSAGMVQINPSLTVQQVAGRTYTIGYTNAEGQFRSTRFQSNALTFSLSDIGFVVVTPPDVQLHAGETAQFFATAFHNSGIELWFIPRWSATGGTVTRNGLYTAGSVPGQYTVTACRITNPCGSTTVTILP